MELGVSGAYNYQSYQWLLNGLPIPQATQNTYIVSENGDYQVAVTNEVGCMDTSKIYKVTNADEPNSIEDINSLTGQIWVFPNPVKNILNVVAPIGVIVEMYSLEGKLIKYVKNVTRINIAELSDGLYFLKIYDLKGRLLKFEKVVVVAK